MQGETPLRISWLLAFWFAPFMNREIPEDVLLTANGPWYLLIEDTTCFETGHHFSTKRAPNSGRKTPQVANSSFSKPFSASTKVFVKAWYSGG